MPFAASVSYHPVTAHATGEAMGEVIEQVGTHPDLVALVASPGHAGALEDVAAAVRTVLQPTVLIGWVANAVADRAIAASKPGPSAALGLWAAWSGPVAAVRWPASASGLRGRPGPGLVPAFEVQGLVVIGAVAGGLRGHLSEAPVAGAVPEVAGSPMVLDGDVFVDGAVGVALGPGSHLSFGIEEGRRRIGPPLEVTGAEGPLLVSLAGRPAMAALTDIARDQVPARDIALINRSVHLAVTSSAGPVRHAIRGRDGTTGALVVDPPLEPGDAAQFCVLDPGEAEDRAGEEVAGAGGGALVWQTSRARPVDHLDRLGRPAPATLGSRVSRLLAATGMEDDHCGEAIGILRISSTEWPADDR